MGGGELCDAGCGGGVICFKQKAAYEMRISDWSSDVCSSDLRKCDERQAPAAAATRPFRTRTVQNFFLISHLPASAGALRRAIRRCPCPHLSAPAPHPAANRAAKTPTAAAPAACPRCAAAPAPGLRRWLPTRGTPDPRSRPCPPTP